ncbi:Six-hairpin glycosidase [Ceraceosorus guamensis]|uniref:Six-hairpin glycosidase n=1 Tax=Ceraceosorus guamensis TaxID=1522189 RepID=A0A316VRE2_9BASI|nr:Six-hairpin glycosidase [Ceraceosorus guamensis]PWN39618.1 Six-hairpin glycosidase [Ceraceosorus guamensis]
MHHVRRAIDTNAVVARRFGNDSAWYKERIPFFESSDAKLDEIFYYRLSLLRSHQRNLGSQHGYVTTEFLNDVSWALAPWGTLNDATGHHINEARWLWDKTYAKDYINFMLTTGGDRHFSDHISDSAWAIGLVTGDFNAQLPRLDDMIRLYNAWNDHYDTSKGLYYIEPLYDATEYTIASIDASGGKDGFGGGTSFRPSINSYMYASARAISNFAKLAGRNDVVADFDKRASDLKTRIQADLWDDKMVAFRDRFQVTNQYVKYWDPIRGPGELVGFLPWTFDVADDDAKYAASWKAILDPNRLGGKYGIRTVEPAYQYYMKQYRYDQPTGKRECQWNGPSWPYQTTQALKGMANLLDHYKNKDAVTNADYKRLLSQYVDQHYNPDTARPDIQEDYDPDTGKYIVGLDRSHDYFHSGFVDLVLSGLVGVKPRQDATLEVNPLNPASSQGGLKYFRAERIPYHGHSLTVQWDEDGAHYGNKGLLVEVDGKSVGSRADAGRLTVPLPSSKTSSATFDSSRSPLSLRLATNSAWPKVSTSSNGVAGPGFVGDAAYNQYQAVGGREIAFFGASDNAWTSTSSASSTQEFFSIEFENASTSIRSAQLFFQAGKGVNGDKIAYALPISGSAKLQSSTDGKSWTDIRSNAFTLVANGPTDIQFNAPLTTKFVRLVAQRPANAALALARFNVY